MKWEMGVETEEGKEERREGLPEGERVVYQITIILWYWVVLI